MATQTGPDLLPTLHQRLAEDSETWRNEGYDCPDFPLIGELLRWQWKGDPGDGTLRYLRHPQLRALETYWYLRLVRKTPRILDLYREYYPALPDFVAALGIPLSSDALEWVTADDIIDKVRTDNDLVRKKGLDTLRELVCLDYPSYILALATGAGKTVLIGTIIATEFCMSLRYPPGKVRFMRNALVFAPRAIADGLREISEMPFDLVLPPGNRDEFLANLKVDFPPKRRRGIHVLEGSSHNLIVTDTERIGLVVARKTRQPRPESGKVWPLAYTRLKHIATLPDLGVFSDEARHTYGNPAEQIGRVRETVDLINKATPLVAAVNTAGTPYDNRQTLKEVVFWYGPGEGIRDDILKRLAEGVRLYDIEGGSGDAVIGDIVEDFFRHYGDVRLPDGARAKIALYFKTVRHLKSAARVVTRAMARIGEDPAQVLVNTPGSTKEDAAKFNDLNNPGNDARVILLARRGVEGWNCPSLFACALIGEQASGTFILQASTRCLRQVAGNTHPARIYLDTTNADALNRELLRNFRTGLSNLSRLAALSKVTKLRIAKTDLPRLEVSFPVHRLVPEKPVPKRVRLTLPGKGRTPGIPVPARMFSRALGQEAATPVSEGGVLAQPPENPHTDCLRAAWRIASNYHLPHLETLTEFRRLYPGGLVPKDHLPDLAWQVERQLPKYRVVEGETTESVALIRLRDEDGNPLFEEENGQLVHRIRCAKSRHETVGRPGLLCDTHTVADKHDVSYHYVPYLFDSRPEMDFFRKTLDGLNADPGDIRALLYTGGLKDPDKTDFFFEYSGVDGRRHNYFPGFVIVRENGEFLVVEVEDWGMRDDETVRRKAKVVERFAKLETSKFDYRIVYAKSGRVGPGEMRKATDWIRHGSGGSG